MPAARTFQRGRAVFTCDACGRRTRITTQPSDSDVCEHCYELYGWQNSVFDGCMDEELFAIAKQHFTDCVKAGGDPAKMDREFRDLLEWRVA